MRQPVQQGCGKMLLSHYGIPVAKFEVGGNVQYLLYYTEQQGEGVDGMDTKRKRETLGELLRAAETWINVYHQERPARGARYPLSARALRSRMSWRIVLHSPSGDVSLSRDWTMLK